MEKRASRQNIFFLDFWNAILLTLILLIQGNAFGQYQKPPPKISVLLKNWSINVNGGKTSFFGELSLYDDEITEKLSKEGAWGYGFDLSYQITPIFSLGGQLLFCELRGSSSRSQFVAEVSEYVFNTTINIVNLLMPDNNAHFFLYGKLGAGQFKFNSTLTFDDPEKDDKYFEAKSPEFLFLLGGGAYYKISNSFNVNLEMAARFANNDKLDGTSNKEDKDYYSYLSLGLTYKINNRPRDTRYYKRLGMKSPLIRRR
ncbi:MAG: outer membrane beta-barrel protein [Bacteroidales bacterium]